VSILEFSKRSRPHTTRVVVVILIVEADVAVVEIHVPREDGVVDVGRRRPE